MRFLCYSAWYVKLFEGLRPLPVSKTISMRQRHGLSKWYYALCICAIGLMLDRVAWAQAPNETYDFNMTKGTVEFGRGHYA